MSLPRGVRAFVDGFAAARAPGLARYVWLPALVSFVVTVAGLTFALGYVEQLSAWLTGLLPDWLGFLTVVLTPLLYLVGLLTGVWLFGFVAVLIASPFLGDLSIAVERSHFRTGPAEPPGFWSGLLGTITRELRKLGYHLPRLLVVFVLTLIPVINLAAPVLWLIFGAWTLAVQFCDYPAENRGRPFRETVELLQRHRGAALGFGACAAFSLAIPLLNFLMIPVAVAGGTLLWRRLADEDR